MASLAGCARQCLHLQWCLGWPCAANLAAEWHPRGTVVSSHGHCLERWSGKGALVCHAGLHGNEGKSFLFRPLLKVFGPDAVFVAPPSKSSFPLMGLEKARLAFLDDWRFNEDVIPYALQLLWFEGAPFIISRPQNQFSGHLRYSKDDPVFITTLSADITELKGKKFLQQGDVDMMLKRLLVFNFTKPIQIPKHVIQGCGHCFRPFPVAAHHSFSLSGGKCIQSRQF